MDKQRKLAELSYKGKWMVIRDQHKTNPYKIVYEFYADGASGFGKHTKVMARYEALTDAMYKLYELLWNMPSEWAQIVMGRRV